MAIKCDAIINDECCTCDEVRVCAEAGSFCLMNILPIKYVVKQMGDPMTKAERSKQMSLVKAKNTKPEIEVKKIFWNLGYRYKLSKDLPLPGKPDIVFKAREKVVFVHGCFWHRHEDCVNTRTPKSNTEFWIRKFAQNVENDSRVYDELRNMGWRFLVIWECSLKKRNRVALIAKIKAFMDNE
jgi:DNA mismatch endonuclease (patch repair protein)